MSATTSRKHRDILGLDPEELAALIAPVSPKTYSAKQIFGWVYAKGVYDFYSMHNLSKPLRRALKSKYTTRLPSLVRSVSSPRERVSKYLLSLEDKSTIECVLIGMRDKDTFCVSTQVGCRFGCAFCATGRMGFRRNLTPAEILGQVLFLRSASERDRQLAPREGPLTVPGAGERDTDDVGPDDGAGARLHPDDVGPTDGAGAHLHPDDVGPDDGAGAHLDPDDVGPTEVNTAAEPEASRGFNVVFMGMGEPLDNYENTVKAIRIMEHPDGLAIGGRRITVSTCGIPDKMKRLAREELGVGLALSLNATTDELRAKLIPAARTFRLKQVLDAARYFAEKSGRRITLEYVLIAGVNDRPSDAKRLISIASTLPCKINLISLNASPGVKLEPPSSEAVQRLVELLYPRAPAVTLRKSKGSDIMAACGQLRTDIDRDKAAKEPPEGRASRGTGTRRPARRPRRAKAGPQKRTPRPGPDERRGRARAEREDSRRRAGRPDRTRRTPTRGTNGRRRTDTERPTRRPHRRKPTPPRRRRSP